MGKYNNSNKLSKFIDSTKQTTRISYQVADIGSKKMKELMKECTQIFVGTILTMLKYIRREEYVSQPT